GQLVFRDPRGRVYPARSRRLAPDFFFHDQVYRHNGESILLPPGPYEVTYTRGPEYRVLHKSVVVPDQTKHTESFRLARWIKLADHQWYSGDHHVHAAGCAHYEAPTQGVTPEAMMRHILGEDLNVGCVLSWGPCWYHQKQFFDGHVHSLSNDDYVMRYDVEVSGFPSSHAGHLCLLGLTEDDYPGTTKIE
ncbi:MAG: CehA/McbA family metallohydrolase, partial [Planctomycetales bacterium]|nr:CehA/McbA family metallohydrolase [Planctomycetales bacterium]